MPKWCLDVERHEVDRFVRMTNTGIIDYVSFRLPSRTGNFQEDLYPPFFSNTPASTYAEWAAGADKPAITIQLKPGMDVNANASGKNSSFAANHKPKVVQPATENAPIQNEPLVV